MTGEERYNVCPWTYQRTLWLEKSDTMRHIHEIKDATLAGHTEMVKYVLYDSPRQMANFLVYLGKHDW